MKYLIHAFTFILFVACTAVPSENPRLLIKAVYLVQGAGQLSKEDLQVHPEVAVTENFDEFKQFAGSKVALWIDINAVSMVELAWLGESPQAYYPVVLVGNGNASCSFFHVLQYFHFEVPCCLDCSSPPSGFSVNMQTSISGGQMQGYEGTPTVQDILEITNPMLERVK